MRIAPISFAVVLLCLGFCNLGVCVEAVGVQPLKQFAGDWETRLTGNPNARGTVEARWDQGKQLLTQEWSLEPDPGLLPRIAGTTVYSYDSTAKLYRSETTLRSGEKFNAEGEYDSAARTFTWTRKDPATGITSINKSTFPDDGIEDWSIARTNQDGKASATFAGKNTRRKP